MMMMMMMIEEGIEIIIFICIVAYLIGTIITNSLIRKDKGFSQMFKSKLWIIFWPVTWFFTILCFMVIISLDILADLLE